MRRRPLSYYNEEEITVPLQKGGDPCLTTYNEEEIPVPLCTMRRRPLSYYNRGGNPYSRGEETLPLLQGEGGPCPYSRGKEAATAPTPGGGGPLPPLHPCPYSTGGGGPLPLLSLLQSNQLGCKAIMAASPLENCLLSQGFRTHFSLQQNISLQYSWGQLTIQIVDLS